ncbi:hypothetical protein D3C78_1451060 [compost metagenome]
MIRYADSYCGKARCNQRRQGIRANRQYNRKRSRPEAIHQHGGKRRIRQHQLVKLAALRHMHDERVVRRTAFCRKNALNGRGAASICAKPVYSLCWKSDQSALP